MSLTSAAPASQWQRCSPAYIKTLPVLDFPFETLPDIYDPARTVLRFPHGPQLYAFQWCYLICALDENFLSYIRRKVERIGASLPAVIGPTSSSSCIFWACSLPRRPNQSTKSVI